MTGAFGRKAGRLTLGLVLVTGLCGIDPGLADGLKIDGGSKSRDALFLAQTALLDGRLAQQYQNSDRLTPNFDLAQKVGVKTYTGRYRGAYLIMAKAAAAKYGVPPDMFLRLVQQESGWNQAAVSAKGAVGLAQLMPETANRLGVDETDPQQNLQGGARYLRQMYDRFGSWKLALAAYNAGPEAVDAAGGIPPFQETQSYVTAILG